jgi:MoxR-like ATPase
MATTPRDWKLFTGRRKPHGGIGRLPPAPGWRPDPAPVLHERQLLDWKAPKSWPAGAQRGAKFHATTAIIEMVNAALYLRRPLLVTGRPGSGKSSLAYAVAHELALGAPLRWSVNSASTLRDALYRYDAIGRLQDERDAKDQPAAARDPKAIATHLGRYIRLGPLGTALLPTTRPRVLLIDEIDKSDLDLPNDLLNVFEEGEFDIPELRRLQYDGAVTVFTDDKAGQPTAEVVDGQVRCAQFPLMVLTSNGERDFPAPFLRRCLRLDMPNPTGNTLADDNKQGQRLMKIVKLQFTPAEVRKAQALIDGFLAQVKDGKLGNVATDQLLNAVHFVVHGRLGDANEQQRVVDALVQELVGPRG